MMSEKLLAKGLRNRQNAADYDRFSEAVLGPWDELFLDRCEALRPVQTGTFVDVGAGTGVVLDRLSKRAAFAGWTMIGLELYDDMVMAGNARFAAQSVRAEMRQGDAQELPLADASVDMVVSRATIHHIPDKRTALKEMARVLRPAGIGLIHDARRDMPKDLMDRFNAMRAEVGYLPTTLEEKLIPQEMETLLHEAGLASCSTLAFGNDGLAALGFEVVIRAAS
ncbi:class I SAM-dependent methyltransferase [Meridianimarinicoccus aquatilis]|uniref:Class I SAM-dependent methyltransferase n=2 Tax=Meridianimarinicoccus aquatilis TaxID=2552766 RepID=A0A4R6APF9_9RHOB|nr:class I SAM-dependent methyltransferase [Fluviibacterium aquatile]